MIKHKLIDNEVNWLIVLKRVELQFRLQNLNLICIYPFQKIPKQKIETSDLKVLILDGQPERRAAQGVDAVHVQVAGGGTVMLKYWVYRVG